MLLSIFTIPKCLSFHNALTEHCFYTLFMTYAPQRNGNSKFVHMNIPFGLPLSQISSRILWFLELSLSSHSYCRSTLPTEIPCSLQHGMMLYRNCIKFCVHGFLKWLSDFQNSNFIKWPQCTHSLPKTEMAWRHSGDTGINERQVKLYIIKYQQK